MKHNLVILAGHGIRAANAIPEFEELIEKMKVPVLLTWRAMDLLDDKHPLNYGRCGLLHHKKAQDALNNCKALLCLGARLDLMQVSWNYDTFAPQALITVVDIDPYELNKLPERYVKVIIKDLKSYIKGL
jgi:acetolactate synthase-1/2/3 large subunit